MKTLLFFLLFQQTILLPFGESAIKKGRYKELRTELKRQKKRVEELKKKMTSIESSLASQSEQYGQRSKQLEGLQGGLTVVEEQLAAVGGHMLGEERKIAAILKNYMVRTFDEEEDPSSDNLYLDRIMIQGLLNKRNRYKKLKQDYFSLKSEAAILGKRIEGYHNDEVALLSFMADLKNDKERMLEEFLNQRETVRKLEEQMGKTEAKKTSKVKVHSKGRGELSMQGPLQIFSSVKKDKQRKGVVYRFIGERPFYSTYDGVIQYRGRLANYGQLIIIDHGNQIRSVLLGDIHPKAAKGQRVGRGDILGYTKTGKKKEGQLYFEVRVKIRPERPGVGSIAILPRYGRYRRGLI